MHYESRALSAYLNHQPCKGGIYYRRVQPCVTTSNPKPKALKGRNTITKGTALRFISALAATSPEGAEYNIEVRSPSYTQLPPNRQP